MNNTLQTTSPPTSTKGFFATAWEWISGIAALLGVIGYTVVALALSVTILGCSLIGVIWFALWVIHGFHGVPAPWNWFNR